MTEPRGFGSCRQHNRGNVRVLSDGRQPATKPRRWRPRAMSTDPAVTVELDHHVATVEIHRPTHNWFDIEVITLLADSVLGLDDEPECRALVLCSEGKNFCAGADLSGSDLLDSTGRLYHQAARIFSNGKPIVAAVQGAAVGGGLGLALSADF